MVWYEHQQIKELHAHYDQKDGWSKELISATLGACHGNIYKPNPILSDCVLSKEPWTCVYMYVCEPMINLC